MADVIADAIGGQAVEDANGLVLTRVYGIYGLETAKDDYLVWWSRSRNIPPIGREHPRRPELKCRRRTLRPGQDQYQQFVELEYALPSAGGAREVGSVRRSVRAALVTETTARDIKGELIKTEYTRSIQVSGSQGTGFVPARGGYTITSVNEQVHRIEVQRPTFTLVYDRIERRLPEKLIFDAAGTINADRFKTYPAGTLLLNVEASEENTKRFRLVYTMTYSEDGWNPAIQHVIGGRIPSDISGVNGEGVAEVYRAASFRRLRL